MTRGWSMSIVISEAGRVQVSEVRLFRPAELSLDEGQ